jgi:putative ABC transport system permease protein
MVSPSPPLVYRFLLRVLPRHFRREFGAELEAVLVQRLRDSRGALARAGIWLLAVADVLMSAAAEWTHALGHERAGTARGNNRMDHVRLDVRFALRALSRQPGFAATAVITLALGIGATIAIFSVVNTVLLQPLPYPDAERIVSVETLWTHTGRSSQDVSGPDFLDWQAQNDVFEKMAAYYGNTDTPVVIGDRAVFANDQFVSADFFAIFGQTASAGRLLTAQDIPVVGAEPTRAVVAYYWAVTHFGSAEAAIGKRITDYGSPREIVGVAPPGFRYPGETDIWAPWPISGEAPRILHNYYAIGILRPGVALTRAQAEMRTIGDNLARQHPENRLKTVTLIPLQERLTGNVQVMLWVLMSAVVFVLLIACANISNLLLARAASRTREVALRAALGAGRARLLRQLLTESLLLAAFAAVFGLMLAFLLVRGLVLLSPADLPRLHEVRIDVVVLLFALGISFVTTFLFGLVPAIHASRLDLSHALAQGGSRGATSGGGARPRGALVVAEVALSVILLAAAGLLLRSFQALQHEDLGFTTDRVQVAYTEYAVREENLDAELRIRSRFYADVLERLRAVPGVTAAAGVAYLGMGWEPRAPRDYFVEGRPEGQPGERSQAEFHAVTEDYFKTLEVPILAGRDFAGTDTRDSPRVAIINETLARTAFPGEALLGQRIRTGTSSQAPWMEIVGVVGDTRWQDPSQPAPPVIFAASTQGVGNSPSILARTSLDAASFASTLRRLVHDANPTVPIEFETMEGLIADALAYPRFRTQLIGMFAGVAILLAAVGIFSVLAYLVSQRTKEIALRRAVGAQIHDVIRLIVGQALRLVAFGLVLGLVGALAVARVLEGLLYEISPWDLRTYLGGILVLGIAALLATLIPAIRAARIPPLNALQQQ